MSSSGDGENALTRYLDLEEPEACITYGYTIPATLGGGYLSDATRTWLVGKMRAHPLLMREWGVCGRRGDPRRLLHRRLHRRADGPGP